MRSSRSKPCRNDWQHMRLERRNAAESARRKVGRRHLIACGGCCWDVHLLHEVPVPAEVLDVASKVVGWRCAILEARGRVIKRTSILIACDLRTRDFGTVNIKRNLTKTAVDGCRHSASCLALPRIVLPPAALHLAFTHCLSHRYLGHF